MADAIPGDLVLVKLVTNKDRYADGEIVEIVTPSPLRGKSPCPVSKECGGCTWLEVDYKQQLEWKVGFVRSALERIGKLPAGASISMNPSPEILNYRNRIHLKAQVRGDGKLSVGYYRRGSTSLVAVSSCAISHPSINALVTGLMSKESQPSLPNLGPEDFKIEIQHLPAAATPGQSDLLVTVFPEKHETKLLAPLLAWLSTHPGVAWSGLSFDRDRCTPVPFEKISASDKGKPLLMHGLPGQFQQVNTAANASLRAQVHSMVQALAPKRLLDVCSGSGNLSLGLASETCYVEGIENNPSAIASARVNVQVNGRPYATYLRGDSEAHLWKCAKKGEKFDMVILDPPREGFYRGLVPLKKISPEHIIYVSCDPATLARDIGALCRSEYEVAEVHAYDFFPNTWHVESLVRLQKKVLPKRL